MGRLSWRAHKMHKRDAARPMSPQVGTLHSGFGPHTLFAACMRASPSPGEVRNALRAVTAVHRAHVPFSLLLLLLLILLRALLVVATSAVAFATLATAMCRGAPGALILEHILAHARTRLLSRQVQLATVLQRRVPQPLQPATVLQQRVPQPLQPATVLQRRVPQPLQPATVLQQRVPQPLQPATVLQRRVPQPLQPATVPRRRVPQPLQLATVPRRRVPQLLQGPTSYGATTARASVAVVAKLRIGLLRASVARNVQCCCYVACMLVLERS